MVRSLKADGAIALMDVQEQVSLPLHSHFIKKSLKNVSIAEVFYYINYVNFNYSIKKSTVDCKYLLYFADGFFKTISHIGIFVLFGF